MLPPCVLSTPTRNRKIGSPFTGTIEDGATVPEPDHARKREKHCAGRRFPRDFPTGTAGLRPGLEAAPLVVDGVLYLEGMQITSMPSMRPPGRTFWTYEFKWPEVKTFSIRGARGLAYGEGRIYMGTQDNHLWPSTPKRARKSGTFTSKKFLYCECRITAPPLYVKGKIFTGNAGSGYQALRGHINAYDAKTGSLVWHYEVIPAPGEPGAETWAGAEENYWKTGGGGTWFRALRSGDEPDLLGHR